MGRNHVGILAVTVRPYLHVGKSHVDQTVCFLKVGKLWEKCHCGIVFAVTRQSTSILVEHWVSAVSATHT
jgi:hypothetical protein